ncbi:MBL fold metallo-hydrolase [Microvirga sp. BT688]|uniref:MBL fold metallo-hydrolase n=1 Tax=Microvirga sp. TaxID=1873136 RepID=UPI00168771D0|nr:MBL fold metallo-hydrolase [Microvirga sp.]MBD2750588.1 MBL fold metallo-hydrolase [Microvirga sp.]
MSRNQFRSPSRRHFIAAGAALTTLPLVPKGAYAAEPYRFSHGAFEITVLSDGFIMLPASIILPDTAPDERPAILKRLGGTADSAPFHVNIPLIRAANDLILVDNGSGDKFQASAGKLASNLALAGVDPASITKVVFTHVHPDHAGGTILPDGRLLCPNAQYFVGDAEWQFWTDPNYDKTMPAALHDFARGAQRDLSAVKERLTRVKPGHEIVSGMRVIETRGHTPGHVSYELAGGDGLIIAGDVSASNIVFFEHPDWHFGFDTEPEIALRSRQAFLDRVAAEKTKVLGYHWVYPGVGYAERKGTAYRFVAA